jgi:hypothetical protein
MTVGLWITGFRRGVVAELSHRPEKIGHVGEQAGNGGF